MNIKNAATDYPILQVLAERWSPYGFDDRPVPEADLCSLFEAARWAASSYNEQPWNYLVATREDPQEFGRLLSCLVDANQAWAKAAPVLVLGVVSLRFAKIARTIGPLFTTWVWPPGIWWWRQRREVSRSTR